MIAGSGGASLGREILIRDLTLMEADLAARFFHENWRPDHILFHNRELLLWMYHDAPTARIYGDGLTIKAAFDNDLLIGVFAYIPFVFNRYGQKQTGVYLSAWWVKPDYRRGSTGIRLLQALQYSMGFSVCVSGMNTTVAEKLYERMGWRVVRNIPRWILPLKPDAMLEMFPVGSDQTLGAIRLWLEECVDPQRKLDRGSVRVQELCSLRELERYGWDDAFWRIIAPTHMGPARETATLVWRYEDIPIFEYSALAAFRDSDIRGLLVYRLEQVKNRTEKVARIVDLTAEPSATPALLDAFFALIGNQGVAMADFFSTDSRCTAALEDCGFRNALSPDGLTYCYPHLFQPVDVNRLNLNTAWWIRDVDGRSAPVCDDLVLTKGDHEFDRPN